MPIYDPYEQRMAVRVVYDGVACAGKTTNLKQLYTLFVAQRSTEVFSPADLQGRTLFFDWMKVVAGVVCGLPLACQVVSVPGQIALTPRRRRLLESADVVVYVCESEEASLEQARAGLELVHRVAGERGRPIPIVLQANKQDRPDAIDGAKLAEALGLDRATPHVEAIASEGIGVVDTFVTAVRTVARAIQTRAETEVLRLPVRRAERASEVLEQLAREHVDPEWAAEMLLEEAQSALLVEQAALTDASDEPTRAAAAAAAVELTAIAVEPVPPPRVATPHAPPVLPSADVPTGFIWPAHTGRSIVRSLALGDAVPALDASGAAVHVARRHVLRTSTHVRFTDNESARQALVRLAREHTQLERLLVPDTVLVAQSAKDGACWIWNVQPIVPTVAEALANGRARPGLLASYAIALIDAVRLAQRHGFAIDLSPASFGLESDVVRYVGLLGSEPPTPDELSASFSAAVDAVARAGDASIFLDALDRELAGAPRAGDERVSAMLAMARETA